MRDAAAGRDVDGVGALLEPTALTATRRAGSLDDAAGAVADSQSAARAASISPGWDVSALANNDAYPLLDRLGDLIRTGPTGTNVGDLQVFLLA